MAVAHVVAPGQHAGPVAARVAERTKIRRRRIQTLAGGRGLARADDPERVAARIDRLSRAYPDVRPIDPEALVTGDEQAVRAAGAILERIVGTEDFVAVRYLQRGVVAGRAVARVSIRDRLDRVVGYGTGALVSPELLLTNHHVLPDAEVAARSVVEFDYEDGLDGRPLTPAQFGLDPQRLFLADDDLDYALVAVRATPGDLARFGCNRLIEAQGKAIVGDFVTIIQHPGGERKQVALRDNRIVDVLDDHLHYAADTEPGSSGSLVFNDQWEVVALHHASVPTPDGSELGDYVNEGIRASRLAAHVRARPLSVAGRALVDGMFAGPTGPGGAAVPARPRPIAIDPDYANRTGYDERFLGDGPHRVPLPALPPELVAAAAVNARPTREPAYVLDYHHFSVAMNRLRRLAFYTAVNIDGDQRPAEAGAGPVDLRPAGPGRPADRRGRVPEQPARPGPPGPTARPRLGCRAGRGQGGERRHVPLHQLHAPARGLQPEPDDLGGPGGPHPRERRQPRPPGDGADRAGAGRRRRRLPGHPAPPPVLEGGGDGQGDGSLRPPATSSARRT